MATKIAINGFGRIGRSVFKNIIARHRSELEVVAINDLLEGEALIHLLKNDSIYGKFDGEINLRNGEVEVVSNEQKSTVRLYSERNPLDLPWKDLGVDVVLECTGIFNDYAGAAKHIEAGAKKVIISAPSKDPEKIPSFVLGVNEEKYNSEIHQIMDMGSCTTNCLAPIAKIIDEHYGIKSGMMTTVHSYTMDQNLHDGAHKDLRRARAATLNMIPTTTGAAKALGRVVLGLEGKINGIAIRVPTATVSIVDLVCIIEKETTKEEVKNLFTEESQKERLREVLKVEEAPLVSSDYIGSTYSAVIDAEMISVNKSALKVLAWYDNEWGYSARLADFAKYISSNK